MSVVGQRRTTRNQSDPLGRLGGAAAAGRRRHFFFAEFFFAIAVGGERSIMPPPRRRWTAISHGVGCASTALAKPQH